MRHSVFRYAHNTHLTGKGFEYASDHALCDTLCSEPRRSNELMNYYVLIIFAPILILTGFAGFVLPAKKSLTSGAPAYNVFHILFGLLGIGIAVSQRDPLIRAFNIGFGAMDLYQAAASFLHIFPEKQFKWKRADDVLHIVIGAFLVIVGVFAS